MSISSTISPCLWFDTQAEEAALFYTGIFRSSKIVTVTRFGKAGQEIHGKPKGSVMTVVFEIEGLTFTALNGGPMFKINEAISFQIPCDTQSDLDYYWDALSKGGDEKAQQCGWLKDKFGVSWQVVPRELPDLLRDPTSAGFQRTMTAMLQMTKLDIGELKRAYAG